MSTKIDMSAMWSRRCPIVYLCGPMVGLTYDESNAWRMKADNFLGDHWIETLSPLRHLKPEDFDGVFTAEQYQTVMCSDRSITARDRLDVQRCDLMLANFEGVNRASMGSAIELGWADAYRKPVVGVITLGETPFDHPMIRDIVSWPCVTLDLALEVVVQVLR